ncbi:hypothetical protein ACZ91_41390 [Streptomyces regensis]|nr:hypothetical protein ACZ91_41390 [Streptomyces regensis]
MSLQKFFDPCSEEFALVKDGPEGTGETGDDQRGRVGARDDDGLFVECGEDVLHQPLGHPRCLRPYQGDQSSLSGFADLGRGTELLQQPEHGRVLNPWAQDPFPATDGSG